MGKQLKCPRCQSLIDVTDLSPGTTVRCPDCGGMARIPTGQTGIRPRVPTPAPQPAVAGAEAPPREATRVRARREKAVGRRRGGHGGLIAGISLAAVAAAIVLLVLVMKSPPEPVPVKKKAPPAPPPAAEAAPPAPAEAPPAAPAPPAPAPSEEDLKKAQADDAKLADWDTIMSYLRSGGAFDDPERAEGIMFAKVKKMGKAAYPYLLKYIDHEELTMARAAVSVLDALTGRKSPFLNAANRAQIKKDWEDWIKANP